MEIDVKRWSNDFISMLFPPVCILCKGPRVNQETFICSPCFIQLPRERNYKGTVNNTTTRLRGMFTFERAYSFLSFHKKNRVQTLLHLAKYKNQPRLAFQLGVWFAAEVLAKSQHSFDTIVPVPLHPLKLKSRGYNQSMEIARGVSLITGRPVVSALERLHQSQTQTRLSRWERFENTSSEFRLINPGISGKTILLIDDIITTGATLAGSTIPLQKAAVKGLSVAAIGLTQA